MRIIIDISDEEKTAKILPIDTKDYTTKQYNMKPKKKNEELLSKETEAFPACGWLMWLEVMIVIGFIFLYGLTNGRIGDLFKM